MKTTFETKDQLYQLCKEICATKHEYYNKNIDLIENNGAIVKINHLFYHSGKYSKRPNLNKQCALIICVSIYPATLSLPYAERIHVCPSYYSKVGIINQADTATYQLKINEYEDKGMTAFFKRYSKRLVKKAPKTALQYRTVDIVADLLFQKRLGSFANKPYRKFPTKMIIVIILLILLFVIRLATPTGYHPSLK